MSSGDVGSGGTRGSGAQRVLRLIGRVVPGPRRAEWLDEWSAELAYERRRAEEVGEGVPGRMLARAASLINAAEDAARLRLRGVRGSMLSQDVRFSVRSLLARPGWSAAVAGTLALGIGATVTIFSLVYAVLLRPLPFEDPDRLLVMDRDLTFGLYEDLRAQQRAFDDIGAWAPATHTVRMGELPERMRGATVNAALFPILGVSPAVGRGVAEADDAEGAEATVVLSHELWTERLGGERDAIGRTLMIDDDPHVIVGVMPEGFAFPGPGVRYWRSMAHALRGRQTWYLRTIGRVAAGLTVPQARAGVRVVELVDPSTDEGFVEHVELEAVPLHRYISGSLRQPLLVFQGAVAALLLIACVNVVNLVLSRAAERERDIVVRAALGAGRARLVRLALTETTVLGVAGGLLGIGLAHALLRVVLAALPDAVPLQERVGIHLPVLVVALGLSLGAGLVVGLLPALRAGRLEVRGGLRDRAGGLTESRARRRLRKGLVVAQLALALTLLVGGGLLLRSFVALWSVDPGLEPAPVLGVSIALPEDGYPGQGPKRVFYRDLLGRLEGIPNVTRASAAATFPFSGSYNTSTLEIQGYDHGEEEGARGELQVVTSGYFATLGIPLLAGRDFTVRDTADNPALIVNRSMADAYFPEGDAVGQRLRGLWELEETWFTIVGVVGDVHHRGLDVATTNQFYAPYSVATWPWSMAVTLRVDGEVTAPAEAVRDVIAGLDRDIPVPRLFRLDEALGDSVKEERFVTGLLGAFAVAAVLLAAVGVYGVVACGVGQRTRELGVRMALGAHAGRVTREVVTDAALMTVAGLVVGAAGALALGGLLQSMLFEVDARDPLVLALAASCLLLVSLAASLLPARRAGRLDPVRALRGD